MSYQEQVSELKDKEILLTGGCGFIGSEITKQLVHIGANVTILDNLSSGKEKFIQGLPNVNLIKADVLDDSAVKSAVENKEYVIHLAAMPFIPDSHFRPRKIFEVNANGTMGVALAIIKQKQAKRFVHISSSEIYGTARYIPMDENHQTTPQSTYAVSKLAGDRVVYTMHKEHNFPAVIIRPFNSFGPNVTQPYIIPEIISQMLNDNNEIKLGNLSSKRDLTFVSDTARAIILSLVAEGVIGEVINVGSQRAYSIRDLVTLISEIIGKDFKIVVDPLRFRPYDVDTLVCNFDRANRLLGWKPQVGIKEGLEITVDWARKNKIIIEVPYTDRYELE